MSETEVPTERQVRSGGFQPVPTVGIFALFLATVLGGLLLADAYRAAGLQAFEDAANVGISGLIFVEILAVTAVFLLAQRFGVGMLAIRLAFVAVFGYITSFVFLALLPPAVPWPVSAGIGLVFAAAIWVHPEWYVLDAAAVVAGAGMIAQFGISLAPLPIVVLLVGMAVYDAYSVYVSGHMKTLASGIGDLKLPMVYVVPADPSYSLLDSEDVLADAEGGVSFLGLGDAFFPGMLMVSAGVFLDAPRLVAAVPLNAPALGAFLGGFVGMVGLQVLAHKVEGVHAGLPLLNGCVLGGYLLGALAAGISLVTALGLEPYL